MNIDKITNSKKTDSDKINLFVRSEEIFNIIKDKAEFVNFFNISFLNSDSEKDVLKQVSKSKKNQGILITKDNKVIYLYKKRASWVFSDHSSFDLYFANKMQLINLNNDLKHNLKQIQTNLFSKLDKDSRLNFNLDQNLDLLLDQLMFYKNADWKIILNEFAAKYSYLKLHKNVVNKSYSEIVLNKISNSNNLPGINNRRVIEASSKHAIFETDKAVIEIDTDKDSCSYSFVSWSDNSVNSHYYRNGLNNNLRNNIYNIKTSTRKINKKEIILGIFGFITFIVLIGVTFSIILSPDNVGEAFQILFSKDSFTHPWIYLLWVNFFISYFFGFLMTLIVNVIVTGKKPNFKMAWNVFIARQLKVTTRFITGEAIIGTILMAWYMAKENNIRVSSYFGTMATMSLIRIPLELLIGLPVMIIGQNYGSDMLSYFNSIGFDLNIGISSTVFFSLAWFGYAWSLIHNSLVSFIIILPPAQYIYNYFTTKYFMLRDKNNIITFFHNKEKSVESLRMSTKRVFKNKSMILRVTLVVIFLTIIEALETMYIFNIIEESSSLTGQLSNLEISSNNYNNFMQLTGVRYMINRLHECPIINIMPGAGLGVVEYLMTNMNEVIFVYEHNVGISELSQVNDVATSFAQETAFVTRFFNIYLQRFLSMSISLWIGYKLLRKIRIGK